MARGMGQRQKGEREMTSELCKKTVGGLYVYEIKEYFRHLSNALDARVVGDYELELVHLAIAKKTSNGVLSLPSQAISYGRERGLDMDALMRHHGIQQSNCNILDEFYVENYCTISRDRLIVRSLHLLYRDARELAQRYYDWRNNINKD
jgi:hypothetical protein